MAAMVHVCAGQQRGQLRWRYGADIRSGCGTTGNRRWFDSDHTKSGANVRHCLESSTGCVMCVMRVDYGCNNAVNGAHSSFCVRTQSCATVERHRRLTNVTLSSPTASAWPIKRRGVPALRCMGGRSATHSESRTAWSTLRLGVGSNDSRNGLNERRSDQRTWSMYLGHQHTDTLCYE